MPADRDRLRRDFSFFGEICANDDQSPLYAVLAPAVAEDDELLDLAAGHAPRQPASNMLFGAVQHLLLDGAEHELREYYRSVGGTRSPAGAAAVFREFCGAYREPIAERVATRRVQTNEVNRCGALLPGFARAYEWCGRRPLALIDVGTSAGLNLCFDRFRYVYGHGPTIGPGTCAVVVRTELRGPCPLPATAPPVFMRMGVDIAPVDVHDDDAVLWVQALIWPDQLARHERFRAAVAVARAERDRRVVRGDALELLPALIAAAPVSTVPCVFHSHAIYQMDGTWRRDFEQLLADAGRGRDVAHLSLEWLGDDPGPRLHLAAWCGGARRAELLAECHHHGGWIRWCGPQA